MDRLKQLIRLYDDSPDPPKPPALGKILVIDDHPNIREGLERTLRQKNYEVAISTTGQEGIDRLSSDISVVILDVKLPRMDGTEVYNHLKKKRPDIPIIFYSAYPGNEEVAHKCLQLKPYGFIEKGVVSDIDKLFYLIANAVARKNDDG